MSQPADLAPTLLNLARDDDVALRTLLDGTAVSDAVIGFHAQQAVEKSLKAALAARGVDFPYTHDVAGLMELCLDSGLEVPHELSGADALSPFGVEFRYGATNPSPLDREQSARWSEVAVAWAALVLELPA
jgi:HEPN domain-containing protein